MGPDSNRRKFKLLSLRLARLSHLLVGYYIYNGEIHKEGSTCGSSKKMNIESLLFTFSNSTNIMTAQSNLECLNANNIGWNYKLSLAYIVLSTGGLMLN